MGFASMTQDSAPRNGVVMNGTIAVISISRRPGMSVRTTAHARKVPATVATSEAPEATTIVLRMAQ